MLVLYKRILKFSHVYHPYQHIFGMLIKKYSYIFTTPLHNQDVTQGQF